MTHSSATTNASSTTSSKTLGVVSLILGIVSIVMSWILPILWVFAGIAAVVLGFMSRKREPGAQTLALWGIILGFIGIALNIASMVIGAMLVASMMSGS